MEALPPAKFCGNFSEVLFMNVEVENLPHCITTLRVEVPPEKVSAAWDDIAKDFSTRLLSGFCGLRAGFLQEFTLDPFVGDGQSKFKRH